MPTIPDDVVAVTDRLGRLWWPQPGNRGLWWYEGYQGSWSLRDLMGVRGPLTEADQPAPSTSEVRGD